jgi:hypothetical protein
MGKLSPREKTHIEFIGAVNIFNHFTQVSPSPYWIRKTAAQKEKPPGLKSKKWKKAMRLINLLYLSLTLTLKLNLPINLTLPLAIT